MKLKCLICQKTFSWERPASSKGGMPPKICGAYDKKDRWVPTLSCLNTRRRQYSKTRKPQYVKMEKSKKYHRCQRCNQWTFNRFNCPNCLRILMEGISGQYDNFIFISDDLENITLTG
jgi:hypothetical protein